MLASIINTFKNCFKIPELKSRILFTLLLLAICRLAAAVRIPGLDGATLAAFFESKAGKGGGGLLGMYSMFTGGALENCAVAALGIMPYISATIIIQLLTAVIPTLSKLAREEGGRPKRCLPQPLVKPSAQPRPPAAAHRFQRCAPAPPGGLWTRPAASQGPQAFRW